jgi:hypothetical protein
MASARAGLGTAHIGPGLAGCWRGLPGVLSSAKADRLPEAVKVRCGDHPLGDVSLEAADGIWMLDVLEFLPAECRTARPVRTRSGGWPGRPMAVPATEWSVPTA